MPKKKRAQRGREESPSTGGTPVRCLPSGTTASLTAVHPDNVIRNSFAIGEDVDPAECLKYLQEMFHGKLDPDVIHMVFTECEFNVNVALEGLFTLLNESPEVTPRPLVSPPQEPTKSSLSSSSSSESLATENIVTSEAEVHKSSEESERESLLGTEAEGMSSAFGKHAAERAPGKKLELSSSKLANFVDAPPFVPSSSFGATNSMPHIVQTAPFDHEASHYCMQSLGAETSKVPQLVTSSTAHSALCEHTSRSASEYISQNSNHNALIESKKEQTHVRRLIESGKKILVLLRGLPGSGKSVLAEKIRGEGVVLSTDHFFSKKGVYRFDKTRLPEAHEWNKRRAKRAIEEGRTPVIIDNTNVEVWEMMPYVTMALRSSYSVVVLEPDTPWKFNIEQLARRNIHGVHRRTLELMLQRYDRNVTAESLCKGIGLAREPQLLSEPAEPGESKENPTLSKTADPLQNLSWRKAMQNTEEQEAESRSSVEPVMNHEESISLQDLMVLTQNDSEGSSNQSRKSSDSWSSGPECNDWEEVTEDDFLWKTAAKTSASVKNHTAGGATETVCEEAETSDSEEERDCQNVEHIADISEKSKDELILLAPPGKDWEGPVNEAEEAMPRPQRQLWGLRLATNEVHPSEAKEDIHFTASWNDDNVEVKVTEEEPKPQRSREFLKNTNSPVRTEEVNRTRKEELPQGKLVTKSLENLLGSPVKETLGIKSLENLVSSARNTSERLANPLPGVGQDRTLRGGTLGLDSVIQDASWTVPDFPGEPELVKRDETFVPPEKKDVSTHTEVNDWALVLLAVAGRSKALPVLAARERHEDEDLLPPSEPKCNTLDQGTDTSDLSDLNLGPSDRLELLQQCVPEAQKLDLEDIFQHCHGDHMWAADLLLESGTVGDLKPLVICEDTDEVGDAPHICDTQATEPVPSGCQAAEELHETQVAKQALASEVPTAEYGAYDGSAGADASYQYEQAGWHAEGFYQYEPYEEDIEKDEERPFVLELTPFFVSQMVEAFGSNGLHISTDALTREDLNVAIGQHMARELHRLWMETLRQTLIREDEEMIEMAQSQENGVQHSADEVPGPSNEGPSVARDDISPIVPQYTKAPQNMSFKEIMEREAELERNRKEREKKCNLDMATKLKHQKLYDRFPGVDRQALDEIFAANNYSLLQSVSTINETLGIDPSQEDLYEHSESIIEDWVASESMLTHGSEDATWCPTVEGHEDMYKRLQIFGDYDALRREATVHYHQRQQSFQKAKEAYHRGMKAVAAYYSQQGRLHAEKMREANERASAKLFDLRNARCDDNTLDLHGLHVQEAIQVLKNFVKLKKQEVRCLQKKVVLKVITGRGAHSAHNIPKLKFAVEGYLQSSQLSYDEVKAGMFHVKL